MEDNYLLVVKLRHEDKEALLVEAPCRKLIATAVDDLADLTTLRPPEITVGVGVRGIFLKTTMSTLSESSNKPCKCDVQRSGKTIVEPRK